MRFWDSSAVVPLLVEEATSKSCRQLVRTDKTQVVWCLTRTEVLSALHRRHREGLLNGEEIRLAENRLEKLAARWLEIVAVEVVRAEAERLLRIHPLRAADALQLASARLWADGRTKGRAVVAIDGPLSAAAAREGFDVLEPSE